MILQHDPNHQIDTEKWHTTAASNDPWKIIGGPRRRLAAETTLLQQAQSPNNPIKGLFGIACFATVRHHYETCHAKLFPNARQKSLFVGTLRASLLGSLAFHVGRQHEKAQLPCMISTGGPSGRGNVGNSWIASASKLALVRRSLLYEERGKHFARYVEDNFLAEHVRQRRRAQCGHYRMDAGRSIHHSRTLTCMPS